MRRPHPRAEGQAVSTDYYDRVIERAGKRREARTLSKTASMRELRKERKALVRRHKRQPRRLDLPFMGIDAESILIDGRLRLALLRAGEHLLYKKGAPIATAEALEFILDLPADVNLVGFKIGHDITKILADIDAETMAEILRDDKEPGARYEYWRDYAIDWIPGHYFRVTRVDPKTNRIMQAKTHKAGYEVHRTILEMCANFDAPFAETLMNWRVGADDRVSEMGELQRGRREWLKLSPAILKANTLAVDCVAELCERFRDATNGAGIKTQAWNGPGKLASGILKQHRVMTSDKARERVPAELWETAEDFLRFGGRIENAWYGRAEAAWHHDCRGAYAASMLELPCLEHGEWVRFEGQPPAFEELYCADFNFSHPAGTVWTGLPYRYKSQDLFYPRFGRGWYWSFEIESAAKLGCRGKWHGGWAYRTKCKCRPFHWVRRLHEARLRLDSEEDGRGLPLKAAINAVAGKFGQITGGYYGPWFNPIWSSLISARVRAWMNRAIGASLVAGEPSPVIAVGTDALLATRPLALPEGDQLGQWKIGPQGRSIFVEPGVYWTESALKSRGIERDYVSEIYARFEAEFDRWIKHCGPVPGPLPRPYPFIKYKKATFLSPKLALWEGRPEAMGEWEEEEGTLGLSWQARRGNAHARCGDLFMTIAQDGHRNSRSHPVRRGHDENAEPSAALRSRWQDDCQPDVEGEI
jgi:hypothetical protein